MHYLAATRHPWACLLFVLPLLLAYEAGVWCLGGSSPEQFRGGVDTWLHWGLVQAGVTWPWLPPLALTGWLLLWCWFSAEDWPEDPVGTLSGMVLESVLYALGLWGLSRALASFLARSGIELAAGSETTWGQALPFLGAGIYEEAVFRLGLFALLYHVLERLELSALGASLLAAGASALLFAAAHHLGPHGQAYGNYLFLFRLVAGLYFACLYQTRGFGIVVGAHTCYNLMVSVGAW